MLFFSFILIYTTFCYLVHMLPGPGLVVVVVVVPPAALCSFATRHLPGALGSASAPSRCALRSSSGPGTLPVR